MNFHTPTNTGIADLFATLAGKGSRAREDAYNEELNALAGIALDNARRGKLEAETGLLEGQHQAYSDLPRATAQILEGVNLDPNQAGAWSTLMRAGGGNAQQLTGGFQNLADVFRQAAGVEAIGTDPQAAAAQLAAGGRTLPDLYTTNARGITTNRFTGETRADPGAVSAAAASDPDLTGSMFNYLTQKVPLTERGEPVTNPLTGAPIVQPDVQLRQNFVRWAYLNSKPINLQTFSEFIATQQVQPTPPPATTVADEGGGFVQGAKDLFRQMFPGNTATATPQPTPGDQLTADQLLDPANLPPQPGGAPSREQIIQEALQAVREGRDLEMIRQRMRELGVEPPF